MDPRARSLARRVKGLGAAFLLAVLSAHTAGCPQTTCEEKATCPDAPVAPGPDGSVDALAPADGAAPACQGPEDCTNGIDDDCNGAIDCADPACTAGFVCVAAAPTGWTGPGALFEGAGDPDAASVPACPAAFVAEAFDGTSNPVAPPASCSCACGSPAGVSCTVSATFFFDSSCANVCASGPLTSGTCAATCSGAQTMQVSATIAQAGACAPQATSRVPFLSWANVARACTPAATTGAATAPAGGGGCGADQACIARPPSPFDPGLCIWQGGDVPCPGATTTRRTYFTGAIDTRGCSTCTCGAPQGESCASTSVTIYSDAACSADAANVVTDGSCVSTPSAAHGIEATKNTTPEQGTCTPSGVSPSGGVVPSGATTFCCAN